MEKRYIDIDDFNELIECLKLARNTFNGVTGIDINPEYKDESSLSKRIKNILEKLT